MSASRQRARAKHMNNTDKNVFLKLNIRDFGPISDAHISLKPLTIFVGPNNSGKSYAAMLTHSIIT